MSCTFCKEYEPRDFLHHVKATETLDTVGNDPASYLLDGQDNRLEYY